jgi:ABC-type oligopeptide transport system substrate-binding subunit
MNKGPINANNYGSTYQTILNSGAYYVARYDPSTRLVMKANPNYRNLDDLHIKKLVFYASRSTQPSMQRLRLETGDLSSLILNPNDTGG